MLWSSSERSCQLIESLKKIRERNDLCSWFGGGTSLSLVVALWVVEVFMRRWSETNEGNVSMFVDEFRVVGEHEVLMFHALHVGRSYC